MRTASRKYTAEELESVNREIAEKEAMLRASSSFGESEFAPALPEEVSVDKGRLTADVKRLKQLRDAQTPEQVTDPGKRDKLTARRKQLEEKFVDYLETWQDLGAIKPDSPEYKEALKKAQRRGEVEHYITEWRELGKQLEPNDPEINSLDRLRKAR